MSGSVRDQDQDPVGTFTVWRFDRPEGADDAERLLLEAERDGIVTVVDRAVVSWPVGARRPTTRHGDVGDQRQQAGWGALWGLLFGALFFMPLLGAAAGAGLGALHQALERVGITKEQMDTLRWQITEGTSALFLVTSGADLGRLGERLRGTSWVLIDSDLTDVEQSRLLGALRS
jgi:uncharacterized membrane protein